MKYRLFDFAGGDGEMLARGGMERVTDHAEAIEQVLAELKEGGWIASEADLAAVGFKTIMAEGRTGCLELTAEVVDSMEVCSYVAPAHNPPYIRGIRLFSEKMPEVPLVGLFETAFTNGRRRRQTAMPYRKAGKRPGCDVGDSTGRATSSLRNALQNCLAAKTWPTAPATCTSTTPVRWWTARHFGWCRVISVAVHRSPAFSTARRSAIAWA